MTRKETKLMEVGRRLDGNVTIEAGRGTSNEAEDEANEETVEIVVEHANITERLTRSLG